MGRSARVHILTNGRDCLGAMSSPINLTHMMIGSVSSHLSIATAFLTDGVRDGFAVASTVAVRFIVSIPVAWIDQRWLSISKLGRIGFCQRRLGNSDIGSTMSERLGSPAGNLHPDR